MFTEDNRKNAHNMIDWIFTKLFPARGMAERPEQVQLSHRMLDTMLDDRIALCDIKRLDLIQNRRRLVCRLDEK